MAAVRAGGAEIGGRRYKRVPSGYAADGARAELLLHDRLYASRELPAPAKTHTAAFPDFCIAEYRKLMPLQDWVAGLVGT